MLKKRIPILFLIVFPLLAATALISVLSAPTAKAAPMAGFTVSKTDDTNDGTCDADCSLREAISAANASGTDDTITLPAGTYTLTLTGTGEDANATGDLDIIGANTITIIGAGSENTIINAAGIDRVFHILTSTTIISGVSIYNGNAGSTRGGGIHVDDYNADLTLLNTRVYSNSASDGGGIYIFGSSATLIGTQVFNNLATSSDGGGISVISGSLTLTETHILSNSARYGGGIEAAPATGSITLNIYGSKINNNISTMSNSSGGGGGIDISTGGGSATLVDTQVISNSTSSNGGGVYVSGDNVTMTGMQIISNSSSSGGGVYVSGYNVTMTGMQIISNSSSSRGGGMYINGSNVIMNGETEILANSSGSDGGGVYAASSLSNTTLFIDGGKINNNSAANNGGGLYIQPAAIGVGTSAIVTVTDSIISDNAASNGNGGGIYNDEHGTATVTNSTFSSNTATNGNGGSIYNNNSTATVANSTFSSNTATDGGSIYNNDSTATVANSTFSSNTVTGKGSGIYNTTNSTATVSSSTFVSNTATSSSGGIHNTTNSTVTVSNSTFANNTGSGGGGIYNGDNSTATVSNSTFFSNTVNFGGGIYNTNNSTVMVSDSTFSKNAVVVSGGGICNTNNSTITVSNSTISGNTASSNGGGLYNDNDSTATVSNSTFSNNAASSNHGGNIYNESGSTVAAANSIIANSVNGQNCEGNIVSSGYNLDSDGSCNLTSNGDISNLNPLLAPLGNNGGDTMTHALWPHSPAIDAGGCYSGSNSPDTDQRGIPRPHNGYCDIGAYEYSCTTTFIAVTNTASSGAGTLRQAIADICDGGLITFDAGLSGSTIDISAGSPITGELAISKSLTISSSVPITISGGNAVRVFSVMTTTIPIVNVTFNGLTIANGLAPADTDCHNPFYRYKCGGGIKVENSGVAVTVTNSTLISNTADLAGGGLYNSEDSTVAIYDSIFINNTSDAGGGLSNYGTVMIANSTISSNTSEVGGGLWNNSDGTMTISNTLFFKNTVDRFGGGLSNYGTVMIANSTFSNNIATLDGGGIYSDRGMMTVSNSTFSNNTASRSGGVITIYDNVTTISNSTFSGNTAGNLGGGIYSNYSDSNRTTISNSTFSNNTAVSGGGIYNRAGTITSTNNIIANNTNTSSGNYGDCNGTIVSAGYNLDSDGSCNLTGTGDISNADPKVAPLADNGGDTFTHALLSGSPAIDAGNCTTGPAADQRDIPRPQDTTCDIGAFESGRFILTINTVGNGAVTNTLSQTIYISGTTVSLTAVADPDWYFITWSGDLSGVDNPVELLMNSNKVITASFVVGKEIDPANPPPPFILDHGNNPITVTMEIPTDVMSDPFTLTYSAAPPLGAAPNGFKFVGLPFIMNLYQDGNLKPGVVFNNPITLTLQYSDDDIANMDEDGLILRYWDGDSWESDGISCQPPANNRIVCTIAHLTEFALMGNTTYTYYFPIVFQN